MWSSSHAASVTPLGMEIGKAFGAAAQPEAELVDVEIDGALDILDKQADIGDLLGLAERHGHFASRLMLPRAARRRRARRRR